jgi:hypothetical protein
VIIKLITFWPDDHFFPGFDTVLNLLNWASIPYRARISSIQQTIQQLNLLNSLSGIDGSLAIAALLNQPIGLESL